MKKRIIISLVLAIGVIGSSFSFALAETKVANTNENTLPEKTIENHIKSIEKKDFDIKTINIDDDSKKQNLVQNSDKGVLFQNNGKEIKTEVLEDTSVFEKVEPSENMDVVNADDCKLFGIYAYEENGINHETYFLSTEDTVTQDEIVNEIERSLEASKTLTQVAKRTSPIGGGYYVKTFEWKMRKSSKYAWTYMTSNVTLTRKVKNASVDGKYGSVWDVRDVSQITTSGGWYLDNHYLRMSTNQPNQKLRDWGPDKDKSNYGNCSVNLSASGPSVSYSFDTNSYSEKDYSSMHDKYGRWRFYNNSKQKMLCKPAIRVTNTKGSLMIDLSETVQVKRRNITPVTLQTGIKRITVPDRR